MTTKSDARSPWGWGYEHAQLAPEERDGLASAVSALVGPPGTAFTPPPNDRLEPPAAVRLPGSPPAEVATSAAPEARASHTWGKSYRDIVRGLAGNFDAAPDLVAYPETEEQVRRVLDYCSGNRIAVIPFGGGSSVCGGTEARGLHPRDKNGTQQEEHNFTGVLSLDLSRLNRVLEIDATSRAAKFQAGIFGPALESALRPHNLTLRHYPQSFEFSTLGGWLATRSGGHFATLHTHIDEFAESIRMISPAGSWESRRLPGSGAGPSPDRMVMGSEGILGVITEAWMRLQQRPRWRASADVRFESFLQGAEAVRAVAQSGLYPANLRLLDPVEALTSGAGDGSSAILVLGFESADHPQAERITRALELCTDHGGKVPSEGPRLRESDPQAVSTGRGDAEGAWRNTFLRAPYMRDALVVSGYIVETFETAIPWDRFEAFHNEMMDTVSGRAREICGAASVACRITHAYPDGCAPYYSVIAPGGSPDPKRTDSESPRVIAGEKLARWDAIKQASMEVIAAGGGTATHHHAVGRDHRPAWNRQRPDLFAKVLAAGKQTLDPAGILNPGVLID